MSSIGPQRQKDEQAPSLFGWIRSAAAKTRDDAEMNPRIGAANVGVSQPTQRRLRVPRGAVGWLITAAIIALLFAVVVPAVLGFIDGVGDAIEESFDDGRGSGNDSNGDPLGAERVQKKARRLIEANGNGNSFSLANCVTAAAGDPAAIAECNQRLLDQVDGPSAPTAPTEQAAPGFDQLTKMSECIERAGSDIDRIFECTSQ